MAKKKSSVQSLFVCFYEPSSETGRGIKSQVLLPGEVLEKIIHQQKTKSNKFFFSFSEEIINR